MLLMSDCPGQLSALSGAVGWRRIASPELEPSARRLWSLCGSGPDLWIAEAATEHWSRLVCVAHASSSQFDRLIELGADALRDGPVATLALAGSGFHGRQGRSWAAAPGNLHLCAALPAPAAARDALALTVLPAVAVLDALRRLVAGPVELGIKWVNDLLLGRRKIGGVITAAQTAGPRVTWGVVGIGVNVAVAPLVPATPCVPEVGALGPGRDVGEVATAVLAALADRAAALARDGAAPLFAAYRSASVVLGREVCIWPDGGKPGTGLPSVGEASAATEAWPPPPIRGVVRAIRDDLSLEIAGVPEPVRSGRLAFVEAWRAWQEGRR
jgi:biotin-[acetyl-CoA-carboxylase] ligase BirA-like protein